MSESLSRRMRVCLLTDVFPPRSGGSGWSAYYLGKALSEAGHDVTVMRPVYDAGVSRPSIRHSRYGGISVEEVLVPDPPAWVQKAGMGKMWAQRTASRLLEVRAMRLATSGGADVLHGQHSVSGVAASRAAQGAHKAGATVVSLCTVRDYWPLCPASTRLFQSEAGIPAECKDCHRLGAYLRCARHSGEKSAVGIPVATAKWLGTWLGSRDLARCDGVIAVSGYVRGELARSGRVRESRLYMIPNLVDLPVVDRTLAGEWPLHDVSPEASFLLFAGKLDVNKGLWMLPGIVARSGVRLPVVVAGDGPLRGEFEREAAALGLDFRFYDWLDNEAVLRLMRRATVLLFPSAWQEPLSRVLLEGCAAGAAIVALDTGGTSDVITHRISGWLAEDEDSFVEGAREVATRPDLNARLRRGAREQAERKFSAPVVGKQVVALYRQLLASRGAAT